MTIDQLIMMIHELTENGDEVEVIQPYIDKLDELVSDKQLVSFLNSVGLENCEQCGVLEYNSNMISKGNEDYSIKLCWNCQ